MQDLLSCDDIFIDLVDSPKLVPLLSMVAGRGGLDPGDSIGSSGYHGTMRVGGMVGRVVPSEDNDEGYTRWHHDHPQPDDPDNPSYRNVKLFVYLWDVPIDGGETAVVPGTHRVAGNPEQVM